MGFLRTFINFIPMFITILPLFGIIFVIFIIVYMIKNKVRIKLRTFKGKGFRPVRGNFGLYVYCGKQGQGKTYSMVEYLLDNKKDIATFCNVANISGTEYFHFTGFKELLALKKILDYDSDDKEELTKYAMSLGFNVDRAREIIYILLKHKKENKQLVFVYDEIFTEIIKGSKFSKDVMDFLCQMRKRKIIFLTTCQEWAELPLSFRRFCRFQIDCDMKPFLWTGLLVKTFKDAENMKWSNDEQEHVAPIVETTITKCRRFIADSYDTFLRISSVVSPEISASATQKIEGDQQTNLSNLQTE